MGQIWFVPSLAWRCALFLVAVTAAIAAWIVPGNSDVLTPEISTVESDMPVPAGGTTAVHAVYPRIDSHPLFYATRQPWRPAATPVGLPGPARVNLSEAYTLIGMVLSSDSRIAFLKPNRGGKAITMTEGKKLDGWILLAIKIDGLHFQLDGTAVEQSISMLRSGRNSQHAPR